MIAHQSEIHFLNWIGDIEPRFKPPYYCMSEKRAFEVQKNIKMSDGIEHWINNLLISYVLT